MDAVIEALDRLLLFLNREDIVGSFFDNRFFTILSVVLLMRMKYSTYSSMWLSALVNIPGTLLHEIMHFVVGLVLNAHPCNFTVFPKKNVYTGDYVMGSVGFRNITFYNAVPSSMAPLLLLPLSFYINRYLLPYVPHSILGYVLYVLLQTIIIENAVPSRADFKIAFSYPHGVLLYTILFLSFLLML